MSIDLNFRPYQEISFQTDKNVCNMNFNKDTQGNVTFSGKVLFKGKLKKHYLVYWAPNPPDYHHSFSGSGLPFPNYDIAYENSKNRGFIELPRSGEFEFTIQYPNAFYSGLGTVYINPHVNIMINTDDSIGELTTIRLGEGVPFRLLTYPPVPDTFPYNGAEFYAHTKENSGKIRTQHEILQACAYKNGNHMPANFWGKCPPH